MSVVRDFWQMQDAWTRAAVARQAKRETVDPVTGRTVAIKAKYGLFSKARRVGVTLPATPEEPRPPTDIVITWGTGERDRLITVDPRLGDIVTQMMNAITPHMMRVYDTRLGALAFKAAKGWPVTTGLSRALLSFEYTVLPGPIFVGTIRSGAPYTRFIADQPFRELIDQPGRGVALRMAEEVLDGVAQDGRRV
jgi:hypothetical protein